MFLQKYKDLAFQTPRGKVIQALIDSNIKQLQKRIPDADQILTDMIWHFGFEQHSESYHTPPSQIYIDAWLERLLHKQARAASTRWVAGRHPRSQ